MASLNKVMVMGNLGKDPEVRTTTGGKTVANFNIATTQRYTDKDGAAKENTEWHRIIAWGKLAEICAKYLAKGRGCFVEGRLTTRKYQKDGQDHWATEIVAEAVQFLPSGDGKKGSSEKGSMPAKAEEYDSLMDIPF